MPVFPFIHLHPYQSYRPKWCQHPIFESIDYCWGLAIAIDKRKEDEFLKDKCRDCDLSDHYSPKCNCNYFMGQPEDMWFCDIHGIKTQKEEEDASNNLQK